MALRAAPGQGAWSELSLALRLGTAVLRIAPLLAREALKRPDPSPPASRLGPSGLRRLPLRWRAGVAANPVR